MNIIEKLTNLDIVIVTHVYTTGPAQELERYLKEKINTLVFIGHPFLYAKDIRSFYKKYEKGKILKERIAFPWRLPEIFMYIKDLFYTILWVLRSKGKFDLYIGADNLNASVGVLLKYLGKVEKVVFYTIDYAPQRFNNRFLNNVYLNLDEFCLNHCDQVWNVSSAMTEGRFKRGIIKENSAPQFIVPVGTRFKKIKRKPLRQISMNRLAYIGGLEKLFGVQLVLEALPDMIEEVSNIEVIIPGTGSYEKELKEMARKQHSEKHVRFLGFIEEDSDVEEILTGCSIGFATYTPESMSYKRFADPAKVKLYLACGLPVIITKVPLIAEIIDKNRAGIAINYDKQELARATLRLLTNSDLYREYRKNAIKLASKYNWDSIFTRAFNQFLGNR